MGYNLNPLSVGKEVLPPTTIQVHWGATQTEIQVHRRRMCEEGGQLEDLSLWDVFDDVARDVMVPIFLSQKSGGGGKLDGKSYINQEYESTLEPHTFNKMARNICTFRT